jgi:hypothetical protein
MTKELIARIHKQWALRDPLDPLRNTALEAAVAIEALQARVANIEKLYFINQCERDSLAAELVAIKNQEPVATICNAPGGFRIDNHAPDILEAGMKLYLTPTPPVREPLNPEKLRDLIASHLTSVYVCTRVWSAWNVGTMGKDDFEEAAETELVEDLATAIEAAIKEQK